MYGRFKLTALEFRLGIDFLKSSIPNYHVDHWMGHSMQSYMYYLFVELVSHRQFVGRMKTNNVFEYPGIIVNERFKQWNVYFDEQHKLFYIFCIHKCLKEIYRTHMRIFAYGIPYTMCHRNIEIDAYVLSRFRMFVCDKRTATRVKSHTYTRSRISGDVPYANCAEWTATAQTSSLTLANMRTSRNVHIHYSISISEWRTPGRGSEI